MDVAAIVIAVVAATPPTITSLAVYRRAASTDRAVNHRKPGEPSLVTMVERATRKLDSIDEEIRHEKHGLAAQYDRMTNHLAWHQEETELGFHEHPRDT